MAGLTIFPPLLAQAGGSGDATSTPEIRLQPAKDRDLTPKQYLYWKGGIHASVLDKVITCESGWHETAQNASSTASGLGQFLNSTWVRTRTRMGLDSNLSLKLDAKENIDTTIFLWDEGKGASNWDASRSCWSH